MKYNNKYKYLTVGIIEDFTLTIPLCCGIVKPNGDVLIPEQVRK